MNIQIFGKPKCFDTKKAERYFKERRIRYQYIDILKFGMSRGELRSVVRSVTLDEIVNKEDRDTLYTSIWRMMMQSWRNCLRSRK